MSADEMMQRPEPGISPLLGERIPAPNHGITFRFQEATALTEAEERALLTLVTTAFNGRPIWFGLTADPLDHLRWKYQDFPGTAQAELLERGDQIVGMIVAMRRRFLVRGHELIARDGVDLAFDPSIQGQGIQTVRTVDMLSVREQMLPEVAFNWTLSGHPTARHLAERLGNQQVANYVESHLKLLSLNKLVGRSRRADQSAGTSRTRPMLESRERRLQRFVGRAILRARLVAASVRAATRRRAPSVLELTTVDRFDDRADEFWEEAAAAFEFIQIRDTEYLNWRFCDPRGGDFVVRAAEESGRLLGYAATRIDGAEAVVADLLTLPGRPDVVRALVADAIDVARAGGALVLRADLPRRHPYRDALRESGFVSTPANTSFGYEMWRGDAQETAFLRSTSARVHLMNADADHM